MVALVPLFLGLFIEVGLIISHRRKDQLAHDNKRLELLNQNRSILANQLEVNQKQKRVRYGLGFSVVAGFQLILILAFMILGPEYDRDVWCEEHRTQFAILTSGLETEKLQADQRRANCEIQKAVSTLQNLFSKENKNTVNNIKRVSGQLDNSVKKLDKANASIDDFKVKIEKATENTEDVLKTLSMMQSIADQLGVSQTVNQPTSQLSGPHPQSVKSKNLPTQLSEIEALLLKRPDQNWLQNNLPNRQAFEQSQSTQAENNQLLDELSVQQALFAQLLERVESKLSSKELIDAIATEVANKVQQQPSVFSYPLPVPPVVEQP